MALSCLSSLSASSSPLAHRHLFPRTLILSGSCAFSRANGRFLGGYPFRSRTVRLGGSPLSIPALPVHRIPRRDSGTMYSAFARTSIQSHTSIQPDPEDPETYRLMLVSDLDFTMVDHKESSHAALLNFSCLWAAEYSHNSLLVYSTGRSLQRYLELRKEVPLLTPGVIILSVGTEILLGSSMEPDKDWEKLLDDGWNRNIIVEEALKIPDLHFQEEPDQRPHKVSFKLDKEKSAEIQERLSAQLQKRGLKVKILYSGHVDLDVLPYRAGKGQALAYLEKKLSQEGCLVKNILVCGDSGNDIDLFTVEGIHGVIVSNAHEELIQWHQLHGSITKIFCASQRCAGGIVQALEHFSLGPHLSPSDKININYVPSFSLSENSPLARPGSVQREIVEFNVFTVKWLRGEVPNTDAAFQRLTGVISNGAKAIYPWGMESSLAEALDGLRQKYGSTQGIETFIWFDNIQERRLADGVHLVTWQPWEQFGGKERRGYFASAILLAKAGTPNGVEWLHFHETTRKSV